MLVGPNTGGRDGSHSSPVARISSHPDQRVMTFGAGFAFGVAPRTAFAAFNVDRRSSRHRMADDRDKPAATTTATTTFTCRIGFAAFATLAFDGAIVVERVTARDVNSATLATATTTLRGGIRTAAASTSASVDEPGTGGNRHIARE